MDQGIPREEDGDSGRGEPRKEKHEGRDSLYDE